MQLFIAPLLILVLSMFVIRAAGQANDSLKIYSKFDFRPGDKILFYDDFSSEAIGDFPSKWNTNGSGEVVTTSTFPGRWLQFKSRGYFIAETMGDFSENFTVEFDFVPNNQAGDESQTASFNFCINYSATKDPNEGGAIPGVAGTKFNIDGNMVYYSSYDEGEYKVTGDAEYPMTINKKYHLSIWVQKTRFRLYVNETKVLDVPKGMPDKYKYNVLRFDVPDDSRPLLTNFRLAIGQQDIRSKLLTEGKLVSYGLYFDTNSDKLKPESYGTLKEVSQILIDNPTLKVRIVGHTDSDGSDVANLDLSRRRAASVKNALKEIFAIEESRIETDGKGETQPVAANDNASNKAKNRRVEFIKL